MNQEKLLQLVDSNPFANYIGLEMTEISKGSATGRIPLTAPMQNVYGGMHGGCAYSLADTVAGIAAASYGHYVTTASGSMNYLLPITDTAYLTCKATEVRQGSHLAVYHVALTNDEGTLVCDGSFTFYCLKKEIAP